MIWSDDVINFMAQFAPYTATNVANHATYFTKERERSTADINKKFSEELKVWI